MRGWHKALIVGGGIAAALIGSMTWYRIHYSMAPARPFEVTGTASGPRVLIATQGSEFKDAVVAGVIDHLKSRGTHVKVIDVAELPGTNESDWNAIVVIHTTQMHEPPAAVQTFIDRSGRSAKLVVFTTSGAGDFKANGVDAISGASKMIDVPARVADISTKLDAILVTQVAAQ